MNEVRRSQPASASHAFASAEPESPLAELLRQPYRFDFFEAVRLVTMAAAEMASKTADAADATPLLSAYEEHLRFRTHVAHGFPASAIAGVAAPRPVVPPAPSETAVPEMTVTFLGLAGTGGVLPWHYTQLLIDQVREKEFGLRDFFDIFNHRSIAHFYRAWEKTHFFVGYESARRAHAGQPDRFTRMLFSLVGFGTPGLRGRQGISDDALLYCSGHLSHRPRSVVALARIVRELFQVPTEIRQFHGQWMYLERDDRTRLRHGANNALGGTAIAGARVWGIENRFRVRVTISNRDRFEHFMPGGAAYVALREIVRTFVGPSFDFDLQVVLVKEAVPPCRLSARENPRLGWNAWLFSGPVTRDMEDAVFQCAGAH